jgi:uncharacterized protein with PIN domain
MRTARFWLSGDLRYFEARDGGSAVPFELPVGLRDLVQSVGIPHVEVGSVSVDGEPAEWDQRIDDGAVIEVHSRYPLSSPPEEPKFVTDVHLARLARYLRLFGFDVVWDPDLDDPDLVGISLAEHRFLLTRDLGLLMRGRLRDGTYVRATDPREQILEILERFALRTVIAPFTRCLACNGLLEELPNSEAASRVPESVAKRHDRFTTCRDCGRVYWPGSHHDRMARIVQEVVASLTDEPHPG